MKRDDIRKNMSTDLVRFVTALSSHNGQLVKHNRRIPVLLYQNRSSFYKAIVVKILALHFVDKSIGILLIKFIGSDKYVSTHAG